MKFNGIKQIALSVLIFVFTLGIVFINQFLPLSQTNIIILICGSCISFAMLVLGMIKIDYEGCDNKLQEQAAAEFLGVGAFSVIVAIILTIAISAKGCDKDDFYSNYQSPVVPHFE
jgi:uncharacterized membrane protein